MAVGFSSRVCVQQCSQVLHPCWTRVFNDFCSDVSVSLLPNVFLPFPWNRGTYSALSRCVDLQTTGVSLGGRDIETDFTVYPSSLTSFILQCLVVILFLGSISVVPAGPSFLFTLRYGTGLALLDFHGTSSESKAFLWTPKGHPCVVKVYSGFLRTRNGTPLQSFGNSGGILSEKQADTFRRRTLWLCIWHDLSLNICICKRDICGRHYFV